MKKLMIVSKVKRSENRIIYMLYNLIEFIDGEKRLRLIRYKIGEYVKLKLLSWIREEKGSLDIDVMKVVLIGYIIFMLLILLIMF